MGIQRAIWEYLAPKIGIDPQLTITAGGAGNGTAVNGPSIDRQNYLSANLVVTAATTLTATKTLTVAAKVQHSADGSTGWTDYPTTPANLVLSATGDGLIDQGYDLHAANRYVRVVVTPTLSNTATDTCSVAAVLVLGGANELPV